MNDNDNDNDNVDGGASSSHSLGGPGEKQTSPWINNKSKEDEDEDDRQEFTNYTEFLLTSVGYCVGLGNLVVYPGRVYNHGGGAFLVAYFTFLLILGIPMYTHDLKVGQYFRKGAFGSFVAMSGRLWGVGIGHIIIAFLMIIYFNVIIGWAAIYLVYSFYSPLPWKEDTRTFFYDTVLQSSRGLYDVNAMNWPVFGANAFAWVVTALVLIKGVSSGGKVAYVTVIAPYICIVVLIIRGNMLPGNMDGLRAYLAVDVKKLAEYETWARAATQIFYSMGVAMGAIITFGSYQQKKNRNYLRDGTMIPIINSLTSFLGGFAIFPMLGYLAFQTGEDINELDLSGFGITFVAYTEGLASFPNGAAQAFSVVFFLMIITLGIDTQIGVMEAVLTFVKETRLGDKLPGPLLTVLTCFLGFLLSLPCTTDAGFYWVTLLWDYGNYMSMFIVAGFSLIGSCFFAGIQWHNKSAEFLRDGKKENPVFLFFWRFVNPALCFALFGIAAAGLSPYPSSLGGHGLGTGIFPTGAQVLSGIINFGPCLLVFLGFFIPMGLGKAEAADDASAPPKAVQLAVSRKTTAERYDTLA